MCKMINAANRNRANGKNSVRRNRARVKVKLKNRGAKKGRKGWEDRHGVLRVCGRRRGGLAWGSGTAGCSWRFVVLCRKNRNGVCCRVGKSLCRERDKKFICRT